MYHLLMGYSFGLEHGQSRLGQHIVIGADRMPCPVCGHPTGDCVGESPPPVKIWGHGDIPSMEDQQTFLVEEDVFEMRQITPFTKTRVLLAAKGKEIPLSKARELGLFPK